MKFLPSLGKAAFAVSLFSIPSPLLLAQTSGQTHAHTASGSTVSAIDKPVLAAALAAYDRGEDTAAQSALEPLAKRYPHNFEIAETLGLLYEGQNDSVRGVSFLERASSLAPNSALASANLGTAYLKQERTADAVKLLARAAALDPHNAQTQSNYGQALMRAGRPAEAAKAFAAAAAADPADADPQQNRAMALLGAGELGEASTVAEHIPGGESSAEVQALLAEIAEKRGEYKAAESDYQRAATLDPSEGNINALAFEFLRHWTFDPAIKMYQFGLAKYPTSERLQLGLGIAEYASNDYPKAAPIFSSLLQKDPNNDLYADLLGHSCSLMADTVGGGCDGLVEFAAKHPGNAQAATFAAASILHRPVDQDELGKATRLLQQAIAADPKLADAYYQIGILNQQKKLWAESVAPLEKAVALRPAFSEAHYRLARAYFQIGRHDEGQTQIALQQKYSQQAKDDLDARFRKLTTFLVTMK